MSWFDTSPIWLHRGIENIRNVYYKEHLNDKFSGVASNFGLLSTQNSYRVPCNYDWNPVSTSIISHKHLHKYFRLLQLLYISNLLIKEKTYRWGRIWRREGNSSLISLIMFSIRPVVSKLFRFSTSLLNTNFPKAHYVKF